MLKVISSSPGELEPVFNAMLENATRICEATFGNLFLCEGPIFRSVAVHSKGGHADSWRRNPVIDLRDNAEVPLNRVANTKQVVHIPDLRTDQSYIGKHSRIITLVEVAGARTYLIVPMLKEGELVGSISMFRQEVRPFTDKQIALVKNFAAQAVIAIENTRLLNELRQRTDDLSESLEQQTATSEVLKVISSSPGELKPVFDALLANAVRICDAKFGVLFLTEGDAFRYVALHGAPPAFAEARRREPVTRVKPGTTIGRVAATKKPAQTADIRAEPAYTSDPERIPILELAGARTILGVPMLKESQLVGAIVIYRQEVRPFTDKQIDLLSNFAAQAVIAIENTRLLNELRESLQQQTATADVLKVISSSPGELEPVFQAMLENAVRICAAKFGSLVLFEDNAYRRVALHNAPTAFVEAQAREPVRPLAASPTLSRIAETKQIICYADILAEQPEEAIASLGGARAVLCVPMLKDDRAVGAISIYRQEVRPFSDKQMEVLTNFAAQAVIAIENTRLLKELRESLQQQTATADVLKVISSSPGELQPVFEAMLENATRICEAKFGILWLREGDAYRLGALHGAPPAFAEARWREPVVHPGPRTALARIELTKQAVHIADLRADPAYLERDPLGVAAVEIAGSRTFLAVPMFKESEIVGAIVIYRQEVRPFTDKQIELVKNFAAQAVIAIENTRLLSELRQRTDDLSEALEQQTATSEVLQVISSSPGELEPVFQAMLENATRICEAKFGVMYRYEHDAFYPAAMLNAPPRYADFVWARGRFLPQSGNALDLVFQTKQVIHSVDQSKERVPTPSAKLGGARSQVTVPMLKDGSLVGAIAVYRQEVRPFTDKQIELVQNFAAQAVIAIENTRLLNELRESLQQQTATADVLKVISSSPGELEPVFDAMLENATRICEAKFGTLYLGDEGGITLVASHNVPEAYAEIRRGKVHNPASGTALGEVIRTKQTAHVADLAATRSYTERNPGTVQAVEVGGIRTSVSVPLLKDDELIGLIGIYRQEVRPFTDKQIALLTNFAAQAVIAIENTRLLSELRKSLQQQTATADVLKVISSSPGELQPVFQALLENATRICEAKLGTLFLSEGDGFRTAALHGAPLGWAELRQRDPVVRPGPRILLAALPEQSIYNTSPTSQRRRPTSIENQSSFRSPKSPVPGRFSSFR